MDSDGVSSYSQYCTQSSTSIARRTTVTLSCYSTILYQYSSDAEQQEQTGGNEIKSDKCSCTLHAKWLLSGQCYLHAGQGNLRQVGERRQRRWNSPVQSVVVAVDLSASASVIEKQTRVLYFRERVSVSAC
jgi:hypothetical protein